MAPKLNRKDYMFMDRKGVFLSKQSGQIDGLDFLIDGCEDCEIVLLDHIAQIFVDYCKRCTIVIGAVATSAFLRNCENCRFKVACGQLRTRDCVDCDLLVQVPGQPIIETSRGMRFGPILAAYEGFEGHLAAAGLRQRFEGEKGTCRWTSVYDFSPNDPPGGGHWSCLSRGEVEAVSAAFPASSSGAPVQLPRDDFPGGEDTSVQADVPPAVAPARAGIVESVVAAPAAEAAGAKAAPSAEPPLGGPDEALQALLDRALAGAEGEAQPSSEATAEAASRARALVAAGAGWPSVEGALRRLRGRRREAHESSDDTLQKALFDALSHCVVPVRAPRRSRSADDDASHVAEVAQLVSERLKGSENLPACGRVWLVASRGAMPLAVAAAKHLESSGAGKLARVRTDMVRGTARLMVACETV